jgi:hypothetical protein
LKHAICLLFLSCLGAQAQTVVVNGPPGTVYVNARDAGATGNGSADDTAAINSAVALCNSKGSGTIFFPAGTYITSGIPIYSNCHYIGAGTAATVIKLKNGANDDVFKGSVNGYGATMVNYSAANNSGSGSGTTGWQIADLTIDGNNDNQTGASYGIRQYGYNFKLLNVDIRNTYSDCLYSDYNAVPTSAAIEAQVVNLKVYHCGMDATNTTVKTAGAVGIRWAGPTDSMFSNLVTYQNAAEGLMIGPNGGAWQISTLHSWGPHIGVNAPAVVFEAGTGQCTNCEAEGSDTAEIAFLAGEINFSGYVFQPAGQAQASVGLQFGQNAGGNPFPGSYFQSTPGALSPGAGTATSASSNMNVVAAHVWNCTTGAVNLVNSQYGKYNVSAFQSSGSYVIGSPGYSDNYSIKGNGITCDGSLAKCGGERVSVNAFSSYGMNNGTQDVFNLNANSKRFEFPNGTTIQMYTDSYSTKSFGIDTTYGVNFGQTTTLTVPHTGQWNMNGSLAFTPTASQALGASGATIQRFVSSQDWETVPVSAASAATGVILQAGDQNGQMLTVINTGTNSITFAAAATSNVADGVSDVIAGNHAASFRWLSATSLWYRVYSN